MRGSQRQTGKAQPAATIQSGKCSLQRRGRTWKVQAAGCHLSWASGLCGGYRKSSGCLGKHERIHGRLQDDHGKAAAKERRWRRSLKREVDEGRSEARGEALNDDLKKWGVAKAGPTHMAYGASPFHGNLKWDFAKPHSGAHGLWCIVVQR